MIFIKKIILLFVVVILLIGCGSNKINYQKQLIIKGDYTHKQTQIQFPENFDNYFRDNITIFNKDSTNISVNYNSIYKNSETYLNIYIYPAPVASERRITNEFFNCLQAIASVLKKNIDVICQPIKVTKDKYTTVGILGIRSEKKNNTLLVLFECGKYFLKYRISSKHLDTTELMKISKILIEKFSPIEIVKKQPLLPGTTMFVSPFIIQDTATLKPILAASINKYKWVEKNIDSLEKTSGYPSLYFEEQYIALSEMLKSWDSIKSNKTQLKDFFNPNYSLATLKLK